MADLAMPLKNVERDVVADGNIPRGVTVGEATLGGTEGLEEAGKLREKGKKFDADVVAVDAVTSTVSAVSLM
jgi:hypothetical protein